MSSNAHLPNPGIKLRSPALQTDSLPADIRGNPFYLSKGCYKCIITQQFFKNFISSYLAENTCVFYKSISLKLNILKSLTYFYNK